MVVGQQDLGILPFVSRREGCNQSMAVSAHPRRRSARTACRILAFAQEPWHIAVAFAFQGLFSGFSPAAIALTSVSVPDSRLSRSLGTVSGAQYLGGAIGPALGAGLAIIAGYRGAIVIASAMP